MAERMWEASQRAEFIIRPKHLADREELTALGYKEFKVGAITRDSLPFTSLNTSVDHYCEDLRKKYFVLECFAGPVFVKQKMSLFDSMHRIFNRFF